MNAEQWVNEHLTSKLDGENIVLSENQTVSVPVFCTFFRGALEDGTKSDKYAALSGGHTFVWNGEEQTKTADELGYQVFFDQWHEEGLI